MYSIIFALAGITAAQITFPVSTQTHFASPSCTAGATSKQSLTVNYNFESVERFDPIVATTEIGVYSKHLKEIYLTSSMSMPLILIPILTETTWVWLPTHIQM